MNRFTMLAAAVLAAAGMGAEANAQEPVFFNNQNWNTRAPVQYIRAGGCVNGACGVSQPVQCVPGAGCTTAPTTVCTPAGCYSNVNYSQPYYGNGVQYVPMSGVPGWNGNVYQYNGQAWANPSGNANWYRDSHGTIWVPVTPTTNSKPVAIPKKVVPQPYLAGPTNQPGILSRDPFFP